MKKDNFWDDRNNSEKVINELNYLKKQLNDVKSYRVEIENDLETLELLKTEFGEVRSTIRPIRDIFIIGWQI